MIPYIGATTYSLFGITFQVWGTMVALGYGLATYLVWRRAKQQGLDPNVILDLAFWVFLAAFIGARLFHVLAYEPHYYFLHPFEVLDFRKPGYAMFGGFIGAFVAAAWMFRRRSLSFIAYADVAFWGIPWGCGIGRIGCFLIHDHPGTLSHSLLVMKQLDGTTRHDLGLYLSLIGFATGILFLLIGRRARGLGFWTGAFLLIEGITRFSLDFLRIQDVRYGGLTPTQWLSLPLMGVGVGLLLRSQRSQSRLSHPS